MATKETRAAGPFMDPNTWTDLAAPTDGDRFVINHVVTRDGNVEGTTPFGMGTGATATTDYSDAALQLIIGAAGQLRCTNGGKVELRGHGRIQHNAFGSYASYGAVGDGLVLDNGAFLFNGVSGKNWELLSGSANGYHRRIKGLNNFLIESVAGNGNGRFTTANGGHNVDLSLGVVRRIGTGGLGNAYHVGDAFQAGGGGAGFSSDDVFIMQDVRLEECGRINLGMTGATRRTFVRVVTLRGLAPYDIRLGGSAARSAGVEWLIDDCGFAKGLHWNCAYGLTITNSTILPLYLEPTGYGANGYFEAYDNNDIWVLGGSGAGNPVPHKLLRNELRSTVRAGIPASAGLGSTNEKVYSMGPANAYPVFEVEDCIGEMAGESSSDGEWFAMADTEARPGFAFRRTIFSGARAAAGGTYQGMRWAEGFGRPGLKYSFTNCSGHAWTHTFGLGHNSPTDDPGTDVATIVNNVIEGGNPAAATGTYGAAPAANFCGLIASSIDTAEERLVYEDAILPARVRKNALWGLFTTAGSAALTYPAISWGIPVSTAVDPSPVSTIQQTNWVGTEDPYAGRVADPANYYGARPGERTVLTYAKWKGLTGADDTAVWLSAWHAFVAQHLPASLRAGVAEYVSGLTSAEYRTWKRADWAVTNATLATAAEGGGAIGAAGAAPIGPTTVTKTLAATVHTRLRNVRTVGVSVLGKVRAARAAVAAVSLRKVLTRQVAATVLAGLRSTKTLAVTVDTQFATNRPRTVAAAIVTRFAARRGTPTLEIEPLTLGMLQYQITRSGVAVPDATATARVYAPNGALIAADVPLLNLGDGYYHLVIRPEWTQLNGATPVLGLYWAIVTVVRGGLQRTLRTLYRVRYIDDGLAI